MTRGSSRHDDTVATTSSASDRAPAAAVAPRRSVELRGRVSVTPDVGRQLDTRLSRKYDGKDPGEDRPGAVRVVVRMAVEKTTGHGR